MADALLVPCRTSAASSIRGGAALTAAQLDVLSALPGDALEVTDTDGQAFLCSASLAHGDPSAAAVDLMFALAPGGVGSREAGSDAGARPMRLRRLPDVPSPPPLVQNARLQVISPGGCSSSTLRVRLRAALSGRMVAAGGSLTVCDTVVQVMRLQASGGLPMPAGRLTQRTALTIDDKPSSPPPPPLLPTAAEDGGGVFPAQRRAYEAVCALLHCAQPARASALRGWSVRPPSGVLLSGPPGNAASIEAHAPWVRVAGEGGG